MQYKYQRGYSTWQFFESGIASIGLTNTQQTQDCELQSKAAACSTMSASMAISGDATPSGVTQFANEACVGVDALPVNYMPIDLRVNNDLQDIKAYFQRPRLVQRGQVSTGRVVQAQNLVNQSLLTTIFPQWSNRLSGAYGIRFTFCIRVQVAATPFHQYVLALAWQYGSFNSNGVFNRCSSPATATNLPHVRLDPSEHTMVELRVPFLYPTDFRAVTGIDQSGGQIGYYSLSSILPYNSVASLANSTFELYVWLEDIELFGADNNTASTITLQSGTIVSELRKSKLVSKSLDTGSKIAGFVEKHVPMLSALAGPTAWALDIASGVAKYFGFSKPLVQEPSIRINSVYTAGEGQVDLPFAGYALGPFQSNTLAFDPDVGASDVDEMSLKFITSQYSQTCLANVSTADLHADVIYATPVTPSAFWFRAPATKPYCNKNFPRSSASLITQSGNTFLPTSLMNIASFFRFWRGTIVFRFTFGKTKFHGGRYMVSFNPSTNFVNLVNNSPTTIDGPEVAGGLVQPYGYSKIMDLKDGNVFEFEVPHMVEQAYLNFMSNYGGLSVVCIDPLQAPTSVTATVPLLVEVKGGDDFELADYAGNFFVNTNLGTIYTQSADIVSSSLNPNPGSSTTSPAERTIGERMTSVKQLIQIPVYQRGNVPGSSAVTVTTLPPWYHYNGYSILSAGNTLPVPVGLSYAGASYAPGALASMYAFARGGSDYHATNLGTPGGISMSFEQNPLECGVGTTTNTDYQARCNNAAVPKVISTTDRPLHVRAPAYQGLPRVQPAIYSQYSLTRTPGNTLAASGQSQTGHWCRLTVLNTNSTANQILLACSAADDALLSTYQGPMPVIIPNAAGTGVVMPEWNPGTFG